MDSVFAALDQVGTSENGDADTGTARLGVTPNGAQPDVEAEEAAAFGKKKKKSSKQKGKLGPCAKTCMLHNLHGILLLRSHWQTICSKTYSSHCRLPH